MVILSALFQQVEKLYKKKKWRQKTNTVLPKHGGMREGQQSERKMQGCELEESEREKRGRQESLLLSASIQKILISFPDLGNFLMKRVHYFRRPLIPSFRSLLV